MGIEKRVKKAKENYLSARKVFIKTRLIYEKELTELEVLTKGHKEHFVNTRLTNAPEEINQTIHL